MYTYNAKVERVVDGDTVDALVDLGFDTWKKVRIRFYGIDAYESRTRDLEEKEKGLLAKQRVIDILNENNNEFVLKSHGVGKYGRCLGEIFVQVRLNWTQQRDWQMILEPMFLLCPIIQPTRKSLAYSWQMAISIFPDYLTMEMSFYEHWRKSAVFCATKLRLM